MTLTFSPRRAIFLNCKHTKIRVDGGSKETDGRKDHSCDHPISEDTWDASPPNLEIMGTPSVFGPPTFATGCFFRWVLWEAQIASQDLLANFKGEERRVGKGMGGT